MFEPFFLTRSFFSFLVLKIRRTREKEVKAMAYRIYTKRNAKWDSLGGRIRKISSIFAGGKEEEAPTGNKQMMSTRNGLIFLLILHAYLLFSVVTSSSFSSYIRPYNTPSQALHERRRRRSTEEMGLLYALKMMPLQR